MKSKYCQWSGIPPSLVLSRPTWNTSNCNTRKASLLETVFLMGVTVNAVVPEIQMPLRLCLYKKLPWKTPWKTCHQIDMLVYPDKIFFLEDQSTRLKHHEISSYIQEDFLFNVVIFFLVKVVGKKMSLYKTYLPVIAQMNTDSGRLPVRLFLLLKETRDWKKLSQAYISNEKGCSAWTPKLVKLDKP